METVLEINALTKQYGRVRALDALSLSVERGTVFGLLGPNGSGKTTTLGILLDIIKPTQGSFSWFGQPPTNDSRKRLGSILETPNFYPYLNGIENLKIVADIKGIGYDRIGQQLEMVNLKERGQDKFKTYSLGMKQRLALAAATLHQPEVLILDEPTNGLDPQGIAEVRDLIRQIAEQGTTILLASHLLDEVQKVCSHVAVLKKGKTLFSGAVDDVLGHSVAVDVAAEDMEQLGKAAESFAKSTGTKSQSGKLRVSLEDGTSATEFNAWCISQGITLSHLSAVQRSLEQQFLELLAEDAQ
ncbi:MAG: ATP-binding cassette domain-containing protein [Bacteroidota bacterium]